MVATAQNEKDRAAAAGYDATVVVPLYNEAESLAELAEWVGRVCRGEGWRAELLFVDDGSTDGSWGVIEGLRVAGVDVRGVRFQRNYGKAAALHVGFRESAGRVVFTMDADLQDSPDELPALYRMVAEEGYDLVSGWKRERHDPVLSKNLPSKLFNAAARRVSGINLHDFNCGLKAYRREVVEAVELYGDMHRYIPVLAKAAGFGRIGEKAVLHYARRHGVSKYGPGRFLHGFLDLMTVQFMGRFGRRPMHFFGGLGSLMFLAGGVMVVWLIVEKLVAMYSFRPYRGVTEQPLFFLALVLVLLGAQCFLAGFVGELVGRSSAGRNRYLIAARKGVGDGAE